MIAAVLAGGVGSRFGSDKARHLVAGRSMLDAVLDAVDAVGLESMVIGRIPQENERWRGVKDSEPGGGPLPALEQALRLVGDVPLLLLACDMPDLNPEYITWLMNQPTGAHGTVPTDGRHRHPTAAVWNPSALSPVQQIRSQGRRSLQAVVDASDVSMPMVPEHLLPALRNINYREDLEEKDVL